VLHRVQHVYAGEIEPLDVRPERFGPSGDDQLVIAQHLLITAGQRHRHRSSVWVDVLGALVQAEPNAGGLDLVGGPMGEITPIGRLTAEEEGQSTDAVVRIRVSKDDGDLARRVEFPSTKRRADPGITATDDEDLGHFAPLDASMRTANLLNIR
jgi:hypothetical protein